MHRPILFLLALFTFLLGGCSNSSSSAPPAKPSFSVGGTVAGLAGTGLVLQLNGGDDVTADMNGRFTFPTPIVDGEPYDVTVKTTPGGEFCTVSMGDGVINGADVVDVMVTCATVAYSISGNISGLTTSDIVLQLNGGDDLRISQNGPFTFQVLVADGSPYEITISTPPSQTDCTIMNGTGVVSGAPITNVDVTCIRNRSVSGTVFGLTEPGLVLQINGMDDIVIDPSLSGNFTFRGLPDGSSYSVTVLNEPVGQVCTVRDGMGVIDGADVRGIEVFCTRPIEGLLAADSRSPSVYTMIERANGTTTDVSRNIEYDDLAGLAYDLGGRMLYGLDGDTDSLVAVDPVSGATAVIGAVGISDVNGLAFDADSGVLYGVASAVGSMMCQLITIDTSTGVGSTLGSPIMTGGGNCLGLAFDAVHDVLYGSTSDGFLITIDPTTGASTGMQSIGMTVTIDGLAFDREGERLFGVLDAQTVVTFDPMSAMPTTVGAVQGYTAVSGLAYAEDFEDLFGTDTGIAGASVLLDIDPADAAARTIGSTGWPIEGMAHDFENFVAYGITAAGHLLEIDQNTGETRYITRVLTPGGAETKCLVYNRLSGTMFSFAIDPAPGANDTLFEFTTDGVLVQNHGPVRATGGDFEALAFFTQTGFANEMWGIQSGPGMGSTVFLVSGIGEALTLFNLPNDAVKAFAYDHDSNQFFYAVDALTNILFTIDATNNNTTDIGPTIDARGMIVIPR